MGLKVLYIFGIQHIPQKCALYTSFILNTFFFFQNLNYLVFNRIKTTNFIWTRFGIFIYTREIILKRLKIDLYFDQK